MTLLAEQPVALPPEASDSLHAVDAHGALRWTLKGYLKLGELELLDGKRTELLDGIIYEMAPQGKSHRIAVNRIMRLLHDRFGGEHSINVQNGFPADEYSMPEPDVFVSRGPLEDYETEGKDFFPDTILLLIEVADSSLEINRTLSLEKYARSKITEYWIVNLPEARVEQYTDPATKKSGDDSEGYYRQQTIRGRGESIASLALGSFAVDDILPTTT